MKRATRRSHRKRIVRKFKRITSHWRWNNSETNIKKMASRGSIGCGCSLCANPRRNGWGDKLTIPEKKALEDAKDQLKEYNNGEF